MALPEAPQSLMDDIAAGARACRSQPPCPADVDAILDLVAQDVASNPPPPAGLVPALTIALAEESARRRPLSRLGHAAVGAGLLAAAVLAAAGNTAHFRETAYYTGPATFSIGSAHQLEGLGALRVTPTQIPARLPGRTLLIFGACPSALGVTARQLDAWLGQNAVLLAMDCRDTQLFADAGGVRAVVTVWESHDAIPPTTAVTDGDTRAWTQNLARNDPYPEAWSYVSLNGRQLSGGGGLHMYQLLFQDAAGW